MELSKELLSRYTQEYALDENTRTKAEELYHEYIFKLGSQFASGNENYFHLLMRVAILVSSRCQEYKTVDDVIVRGADLSVTQFLRGSPEISIDDFVHTLGLFIEQVRLDDVVISDCTFIMKEFQQALTVYGKFDEVWSKLGIKDKTLNKVSEEKIRKFAWLIFSIAKVRLLQRRGDLVESAYTLVAVFIHMIQLLPAEVDCELVHNFKKDTQIQDPELMKQRFQEYLIQYFKSVIKAHDAEPILISLGSIEQLLLKLKEKGVLRGLPQFSQVQESQEPQLQDFCHQELAFLDLNLPCQIRSRCLHGLLDAEYLSHNYQKLDLLYQKKLQPSELDDRHFINTDMKNLTPCKLSPFARHSIYNKKMQPPTPQKQQNSDGAHLEPPNKRVMTSSRHLNYESNSSGHSNKMENAASITLEQKLNEIRFPQKVPNSPYSIKQITPATPISMMMELKTWLNQNLNRVVIDTDYNISKNVLSFINPKNPEQREPIAKYVSEQIDQSVKSFLNFLAQKENARTDQRVMDTYMVQYGKSTRLLTFRILDELLIKEQRTSAQPSVYPPDFSHLLSKDIFLKSVFACALETVLFIMQVKHITIFEIITMIGLQSFDMWRLLASFLKFDQQMPRNLNDHFRQLEAKIVCETAWSTGSSVVTIIRNIFKEQKELQSSAEEQEMRVRQEQVIQSYQMFFKRVLHLASQKVVDLGQALNLSEEILEKVWIIMKLLLGHETQLLMNRHLDQLVMCTIFCVCKVHPEIQITFSSIINKYAEQNRHIRHVQNIYMQVETINGQKQDVIQFYNQVYIKTMKEYITFIKPNFIQNQATQGLQFGEGQQPPRTPQVSRLPLLTPQLSKPSIKALCPQSPLKQSLPPQMMYFNTIYQQNVRSRHGTPLIPQRVMQSPLHPSGPLTPFTQTLYAYGESQTGELDKIHSMFKNKPQQNTLGTANFLQPPSQEASQKLRNSFIQNVQNKQVGQLKEPQIMPTVQRGALPTLGEAAAKLIEPKKNLIKPQINMAGIANLSSSSQSQQKKDAPMSEPTINVGASLSAAGQQLMAGMAFKKENNSSTTNQSQNSSN